MPTPLTRRRPTRLLSLVLLLLQAFGAGGVALAHAADATGGAVSIEARHTAQCAVLHDASRCALCHFAQMRAAATPAPRIPAPTSPQRSPRLAILLIVPAGAIRPAALPRGPPTLFS